MVDEILCNQIHTDEDGQNEMRPRYDNNFVRVQLQESSCKMDLRVDVVPILPPENNFRGVLKEMNHILLNVKLAFKYMNKELFRKLYQIKH